MKKFFKKLSGKTEKKSFKEIPLDRKATYKQQWAVAWQFARECRDDFPYQSEKALAVIFNAVIFKYHSDPECTTVLTHGDVQEYLAGNKKCPDHYKKLIHVDLRDKANSSPSRQTKETRQAKPFGTLSDEEIQQFIERYNNGTSLRELGEDLGISTASVRNYINRLKDAGHDIEMRGQGGGQKHEFLNDKRKVMRLVKLYKEDYTFEEIGHALNISLGSARNYINNLIDQGMDLERRGRGSRSDTRGKRMRVNKPTKEQPASNKQLLDIMKNQKRT